MIRSYEGSLRSAHSLFHPSIRVRPPSFSPHQSPPYIRSFPRPQNNSDPPTDLEFVDKARNYFHCSNHLRPDNIADFVSFHEKGIPDI